MLNRTDHFHIIFDFSQSGLASRLAVESPLFFTPPPPSVLSTDNFQIRKTTKSFASQNALCRQSFSKGAIFAIYHTKWKINLDSNYCVRFLIQNRVGAYSEEADSSRRPLGPILQASDRVLRAQLDAWGLVTGVVRGVRAALWAGVGRCGRLRLLRSFLREHWYAHHILSSSGPSHCCLRGVSWGGTEFLGVIS